MSLFRHHPDDQRHRVDRQAQRASSRRLTPGRQLLSRKPVPACHFRDHRPRRIGLRNNLALDLVAPATAKSHSNPDLKETLWFRSADYMLDHRCEPIRARWIACCTSARSQQGGEKRPLSVYGPHSGGESCQRHPVLSTWDDPAQNPPIIQRLLARSIQKLDLRPLPVVQLEQICSHRLAPGSVDQPVESTWLTRF